MSQNENWRKHNSNHEAKPKNQTQENQPKLHPINSDTPKRRYDDMKSSYNNPISYYPINQEKQI